MYSFVFRVDSGNIPELGTGHLYRCIKIYNYLIKKKVNKNKILFIIKTKGNYKTSKKILKQFDIKYISIVWIFKNQELANAVSKAIRCFKPLEFRTYAT